MAIRVHYGTQVFETAETDAAQLRGELWEVISSGKNPVGLWKLATDDGELHLLITRDSQIAIVEYEKPVKSERKGVIL